MSIAAVLIVRNEASALSPCLESVQPVVDEIVVMDTGSDDATLSVAKQFTSAVYTMTWPNNFATARNAALSHATADWILQIDADERIAHPETARALLDSFVQTHNARTLGTVSIESAFTLHAQRQVMEAPIVRFFARGHAHYEGLVHEQIVPSAGDSTYAATGLRLIHLGYDLPPEAAKRKADRNRSLLRKAVESDPTNPYYRYQLGKTFFSSGQFGLASIQFRDALQLVFKQNKSMSDTNLLDCVVSLAYSLASTGRLQEALTQLDAATQSVSGWADYHHARGYIHLQLGNVTEGRQAYTRALTIGSEQELVRGTGGAASHYHLGLLAEADRDLETAARQYTAALRLAPDHEPTIARIADWPAEYGVAVASSVVEHADEEAFVRIVTQKVLELMNADRREDAQKILVSVKDLPSGRYDLIARRLTGA